MDDLIINGNSFHDGIIQETSINFDKKEISIIIKQWFDNDYELTLLEFKKIQWQNFNNFSDFNILYGIELTNLYPEFEEREHEYLERMYDYFPSGKLEEIRNNTNLKFYFLQSSFGLDGFVICEQLKVSELKK